MRKLEYVLSLTLALLVLSGLIVWTQASSTISGESALSCRPGKASNAVVLKGISLYPRCPGGRRL